LNDFETLVRNVQAWPGTPRAQLLDKDVDLAAVLRRIFVTNTRGTTGILRNLNRQELLRDMAEVSHLPSFVPTLRQVQKPDRAVKGVVAEIQQAANDIRTIGRERVEDINRTLFKLNDEGQLKKWTDFDIVSNGTLWQLKVGPNESWRAWEFEDWLDKAIQYAKDNGYKKIGFRLDLTAQAKFNGPKFKLAFGFGMFPFQIKYVLSTKTRIQYALSGLCLTACSCPDNCQARLSFGI